MTIIIQKADDYPPLPMCALAGALCDLLNAADGLEQPRYITISNSESIGLQFGRVPGSLDAILSWALRFGAPCVVKSRQDTTRGPEQWVDSEFDWYGVRVEMYAHIPLGQPEHAGYPHEPGRLHDCPACMAACHCTPGTAECVYDGPHRVPPF